MAPSTDPRRVRDALVVVLAAVAALVVPSLAVAADGSASLTVAVVALGLAALIGAGNRHGVLLLPSGGLPPAVRRVPAPLLAGRVTDPVRHPLRPRAPGVG